MPFIPTPNVAKLSIRALLGGEQCQTIMYAHRDDPWGAAELQALAVEAMSEWKTSLLPRLPAHYVFNTVEARDVSAEDGEIVEVVVIPPNTGTAAAGSGLPNSVSIAVKKISDVGGRSGRGRLFMPVGGINHLDASNSNMASQTWVSGVLTGLEAFQNAVEAEPISNPQLGFVSFYSGGAPREQGLFRRVKEYIVADRAIDNMRRRLPGRGD